MAKKVKKKVVVEDEVVEEDSTRKLPDGREVKVSGKPIPTTPKTKEPIRRMIGGRMREIN
tara:strand:+ start:219 stop:398 length:180 start_codon:yes stop_codon:yes gene_type:complete